MLFVSHPCADMIRDHFKQKALVYGYIGEEVYPYIPEEEESEWDDDAHCDACLELWDDCQCWCGHCWRTMPECHYTCDGFS